MLLVWHNTKLFTLAQVTLASERRYTFHRGENVIYTSTGHAVDHAHLTLWDLLFDGLLKISPIL